MKRLRLLPLNEQGQSIVILVLLLSFVFLAMAALAIDGTNVYLRRRQLQNVADAAALAAAIALAQGDTETVAYQAAMDSIASNEGRTEWYSTSASPNPPATNVGSGSDLSLGIEISGSCDVRVAVTWSDIGTYFAQFVGRDTLEAGAKARAGCNQSGGLMPIAVKRFGDQFDWDDTPGLNASSATVYCDECNTQVALTGPPDQGKGNVHDFLRVEASDVITQWPGWGIIGSTAMYTSPSPHADLASGAPGRDYFILGSEVKPNVGTVSYAGAVVLDIRHLSAPPTEYYNGVITTTNPNTLKDWAEYYIRRGYCCDIPKPGDQVATLDGASASFLAKAFQQTYAISDVVAVIVYDGHVLKTPNLEMTGSPGVQSTHPTTTTIASSVLTYTINLEGQNGFKSSAAGLTMDIEGLAGFADWSLSNTSPVLGHSSINQQIVTLYVTPTLTGTTQVVTGTRMFYVSAYDNKEAGTDQKRYWAGILTVGDEVNGVQRDLPEVTGTPTNSEQNYPYLVVEQGQQAKYSLDLDLWNFTSNQDVTVSGTLPGGFDWVGGPPSAKSTKYNKHAGASFNIALKVDAAAKSTPYEIPLTVSAPGAASQTFNLYVLVVDSIEPPKDYVEILGYAALQVTDYPSVNSVRGRIISKLVSDPSDLTYGLRTRLIPWE